MSDGTNGAVAGAFDAFVGTEITFRSLAAWPGVMTENRRNNIFGKTTTIRSTIALLKHEMRQIDASDPMIAMAIQDRDIRRDGYPRNDARPAHPGVVISFDTEHGRLVYKCDTFNHWHWNIRAIALTLEALRKPDRYGVLKAGEQYTGNRMLTAGGVKSTMNVRAAAEFIASHSAATLADGPMPKHLIAYLVEELMASPERLETEYRVAAKHLHPDKQGGSPEKMDLLTKARATLRAHHGLTGDVNAR